MKNMHEVPTDELLSFQDFPPVHNPSSFSSTTPATTIPVLVESGKTDQGFDNFQTGVDDKNPLEEPQDTESKSFWTLKYYQKYFDVDTRDVLERILASVTPIRRNMLGTNIKTRPDLYGPFWISITLIFTIAISGNIANYLQHGYAQYHWKYDFHLVSYAATAIVLYICLVPVLFWGLLKWTSQDATIGDIESENTIGPLELICIYGYSLFIYIPVSILWTIQIRWFQWILALVSSLLSGSVLLFTLKPAISVSRHKLILMLSVLACHFLLAAGFMLYFFHVPDTEVVIAPTVKPAAHVNKTAV